MKITNCYYQICDFILKEPYTISYQTISHSTNIILTIETSDKISGYGSAAPDPFVTNENPAETVNVLEKTVIPFLLNKDPLRINAIMEELHTQFPQNPGLLAMIDMALYDILGKKANLPLYTILGGYRRSIATSITIGILPLEETLKKAKEFMAQGFKIIKLKGGLDLQEDIQKIKKIHDYNHNIKIRFDANQGYTLESSIAFFQALKHLKIQLMEQPTDKNNLVELKKITKIIDFPVMADESIIDQLDAFKLAKNKIVDMLNIKLMKCGGISQAKHINSIAQAAKMEVMVGCMDECAISIAAALHFTLSRFNVKYADLDSHLDIVNDPSSKSVILKDGILYPTELPGLGIVWD